MSLWSHYYPHLDCSGCRTQIREGERIFHCRSDHSRTLCSECGKAEAETIAAHVCDWCGVKAEDREALGRTGRFVYWCRKHTKVGIESTLNWEPASKGSLADEMRRDKLGNAEEARV